MMNSTLGPPLKTSWAMYASGLDDYMAPRESTRSLIALSEFSTIMTLVPNIMK